jgi:hypothetical protein
LPGGTSDRQKRKRANRETTNIIVELCAKSDEDDMDFQFSECSAVKGTDHRFDDVNVTVPSDRSSNSGSESSDPFSSSFDSGSDSDERLRPISIPFPISTASDVQLKGNVSSDFIRQGLVQWALETGNRGRSLTSLLKVLRSGGITGLPLDGRSILRTRRDTEFEHFSDGQFYYFGISSLMLFVLRNSSTTSQIQSISLQFNIDGVPLFKSDSTQF